MNKFLDSCKKLVQGFMKHIARGLNKLTGGKLHPNAVTIFALIMHLPIAFLIANGRFGWAAAGLLVFGLFDTLDGELARLQHRVSSLGTYLDSVSDRMKEGLLYIGIGYFLVNDAIATDKSAAYFAAVTIAAAAGSLLVSYTNAWGDAVMAQAGITSGVNKTFRTGLLRFEVRIFLLIVGLAFNWLATIVVIIALLAWGN